MADSEFNLNPDVSQFDQDDHLMANASPARKMFSSSPVSPGVEVTVDNQGGNMTTVRSLAKAIKKDGKLRYPKS